MLQTITASEQVSRLSSLQSRAMQANDLIAFILEEAQHCLINNERSKDVESAMAARTKKTGKPKGKRRENNKSDITCESCKKTGHGKPDCYSKGGGKEGQGSR